MIRSTWHKRGAQRVATLFSIAALVLVGVTACLPGDAYQFRGGVLEPAKAAPPLDLTDQFGQPFSLSAASPKIRLIYFGYSTCPDFCPTTLTDFLSVKEDLGDGSKDVEFILVTVDPARDTEERLREYLAFFDPAFVGLRGDEAETVAASAGYGVFAQRVDQPESATGYLVDHTSMIYVLDEAGDLRLTFGYGSDPADIAADIRHLLSD